MFPFQMCTNIEPKIFSFSWIRFDRKRKQHLSLVVFQMMRKKGRIFEELFGAVFMWEPAYEYSSGSKRRCVCVCVWPSLSFDMPYHTQITHINQFLGVMNMKCIQFFVEIQPHSFIHLLAHSRSLHRSLLKQYGQKKGDPINDWQRESCERIAWKTFVSDSLSVARSLRLAHSSAPSEYKWKYMQMTTIAIYTSTRWFNTPVMTIVTLWMIFSDRDV